MGGFVTKPTTSHDNLVYIGIAEDWLSSAVYLNINPCEQASHLYVTENFLFRKPPRVAHAGSVAGRVWHPAGHCGRKTRVWRIDGGAAARGGSCGREALK